MPDIEYEYNRLIRQARRYRPVRSGESSLNDYFYHFDPLPIQDFPMQERENFTMPPDNDTLDTCELCHNLILFPSQTRIKLAKGYIHGSCWPSELEYAVRFNTAIVYKPNMTFDDYSISYSYLIVNTEFTNLLEDRNTPYTVVLLKDAKGVIDNAKHDHHIVTISPSIEIKNMHKSGQDVYITNFAKCDVNIDDCTMYGITVEARAACNIFVTNLKAVTLNVKSHVEANKIDLVVESSEMSTAQYYNINALTTRNCIVSELYIKANTWHDEGSTIKIIEDENDVTSIDLHNTRIVKGVLTSQSGTIDDCTLATIKHEGLTITRGSIRFIVPTICSICKEVIRDEPIMIKGNKIHSNCWCRDGSRTANNKYKGDNDNLPTFSIELELNGQERDPEYTSLLYDLLEQGFIRCSDGTVSDELKSPIFKNMGAFTELETLLCRSVPYITNRCRTHVHVQATRELKDVLYNNHPRLFALVANWLHDHAYTVHEFFGCTSSSLCSYVYTGDRFCWLNASTPYDTIEYRLSQMYSYEQFERLIHFFRDFTRFLEKTLESMPEDRNKWPKTKDKAAQTILDYLTTYIGQFDIEEREEIHGVFVPYTSPFTTYASDLGLCGDPDCRMCYPGDNDDSDDDYDPFDE